MIPAWVAPYVGIPFRPGGRDLTGWDCYGAVFHIYREIFQIALPRYDPTYAAEDWPSISAAVTEGAAAWTPQPLAAADVGNVLVLRLRGLPLHVGLVVDPAPLTMLHVLRTIDTCCQRLDNPIWAPRVIGCYRWTGAG